MKRANNRVNLTWNKPYRVEGLFYLTLWSRTSLLWNI